MGKGGISFVLRATPKRWPSFLGERGAAFQAGLVRRARNRKGEGGFRTGSRPPLRKERVGGVTGRIERARRERRGRKHDRRQPRTEPPSRYPEPSRPPTLPFAPPAIPSSSFTPDPLSVLLGRAPCEGAITYKDTAELVKHPVLWSIDTLQVLGWSASSHGVCSSFDSS